MKNVLRNVTCGVYIVSSKGEKNAGCVVNTLCQVNSVDPLISISINKENFTNSVIKDSKKFAISFLNVDASMDMLADFGFKSSKEYDKFCNIDYKEVEGIPVVMSGVSGYLICEVKDVIDCDTHDLFVARVIRGEEINEVEEMSYKYYHKVKKGTTPLKAPSYIEFSDEGLENDANKYQCIICGHLYDDGVEEIKFEDLPDDWVCPKCRVGKDKFKKIN